MSSVSFGGIAGLFLGVSLLTVVELGYYLMKFGWAIYNSIRFRKNQSSTAKYPASAEDMQKITVPTITDKVKIQQKYNGFMW